MNVFGIVGYKNSGKTTMVERLVAVFTERGFAVSTVKHAHHAMDVDQPGRDSYRHREAGAREVLVSSGSRWALMHELSGAPEPSLDELLSRLTAVDLVLVEGFKTGRHRKVEVHRAAAGQRLLATTDRTIEAVATDVADLEIDRPVLPLNAPDAVADFIAGAVGLGAPPSSGPARS